MLNNSHMYVVEIHWTLQGMRLFHCT